MSITLTDKAAARILALTQTGEHEGQMLRLTIDAGGCSGFEYRFSFAASAEDDDQTFEHNGAYLVVDKASLDLIDGSTLDYAESLMGSHFAVINPNAASGCGCGNSFSL